MSVAALEARIEALEQDQAEERDKCSRLLRELRDELAEHRQDMDDRLDELPALFAREALGVRRRRHECIEKAAQAVWRDPVVRRVVAITFLLAVVLTIAGALLNSLDLQLGDWLSLTATQEP